MERLAPCDVCKLVSNDYTPKPCIWCSLCHAWLCREHRGWSLARLQAAVQANVARLFGRG